MDHEAFFAHIKKAVISSGCDLDRLGFSMTVEGDRWRITRPRSPYDNDLISLSSTNTQIGAANDAIRSLRRWWSEQRYLQAKIAAHDWLYGARDKEQRPYMIDALILRRFELAGIDRYQLADILREQIGPRPGIEQIHQRLDRIYSSFQNNYAPVDFGYRWRSNLTPTSRRLDAAGPIQFRLAGNGGSGMWAYFNIAPGAFYCGGPSPAIWLKDNSLQALPETLLLGLRGEPVTRLASHPALEIEGLRISSIRKEAGRLTVALKPLRENLNPVIPLAKAA